jgi:hypothetical protein
MKNCLFTSLITLISLLIAGTVFSYPYEDNAGRSPYDDGWQTADNGNIGSATLSPWNLEGLTDCSCSAVDATSVGGSSLLNTDGRAWVLSTNRTNTTASDARITRTTNAAVIEGTVGQIDIQILNPDFFSSLDFCEDNDPGTLLFTAASNGHANWTIYDGNNNFEDLGIPAVTPIRVRYLDGPAGTDYTLQILQLSDGAVLYNGPRTSLAATSINTIHIEQRDNTTAGTDDIHVIMNNLIFDTTGTLPVELDFFMVE